MDLWASATFGACFPHSACDRREDKDRLGQPLPVVLGDQAPEAIEVGALAALLLRGVVWLGVYVLRSVMSRVEYRDSSAGLPVCVFEV